MSRSGVHLFFTKDLARGQWVCRLCGSELTIQPASSTSNIHSHLTGHHRIPEPTPTAESLTDAVRNGPMVASSSGKQTTLTGALLTAEMKVKIRRAVVNWLVADELAFDLTASQYFKNLMEVLRPGSSSAIPSPQQLYARDLPELYDTVCELIVSDLAEHKGPMAWMTDGWTANYSSVSFAMSSVAFCEGLALRRVCIGVQEIPEGHDAASLRALLHETLTKFKIAEQAWIGVTDTAAVMKALCTSEMRHCWMPCIAHTLNLVIRDATAALQPVDENLQLLTEVARYFRQSSIAAAHLGSAIERTKDSIQLRLSACDPRREAGKQLPRKLKLRAPTRWNSVVEHLRRFYVLAPAVIAAMAIPEVINSWEHSPGRVGALEVCALLRDLTHIRPPRTSCFVWDVIRCLSPLEDFSYFVQYRDVPVLGPAFVAVASSIEQVRAVNSEDMVVIAFRDAVYRSLVQRFTDPGSNYRTVQFPAAAVWQGDLSANSCPINFPLAYMAVAAILDPRLSAANSWRTALAQSRMFFPTVRQGQVDATDTIAARLLTNAAAFEASLSLPPAPAPPAAAADVLHVVSEEVIEQGTEVDQRWRVFTKRQRLEAVPLAQLDLAERIQREVKVYLGLHESEFGMAQNFTANPLEFWESQKTRLPLLAKAAQRFLNIPASSAEVERIASTGGRVVTADRAAMKAKTASMLIFLAHNHVYLTLKAPG